MYLEPLVYMCLVVSEECTFFIHHSKKTMSRCVAIRLSRPISIHSFVKK